MSDNHLRDDVPECRTDDYKAAMLRKYEFISDLQRQFDCDIYDGGDMFDRWQVSSELEGLAILNLPDRIITVPGNHDLKNHNLSMYKKSSLHVLGAAKKITVLRAEPYWPARSPRIKGYPFGSYLGEDLADLHTTGKNVAIVHVNVANSFPPNVEGYTPEQLVKALPGYDLIVSGHNHNSLVYETRDEWNRRVIVVNPGSMMRMFADQVDVKPRVYLWYANEHRVEPVYLPIEAGVVSRAHIDRKREHDDKLSALVTRIKQDSLPISMSFERNMDSYFAQHGTRREVREIIMEAIQE